MYGVEMAGVARYLAENRNRAFMHWDAIAYPRSGFLVSASFCLLLCFLSTGRTYVK